MSDADPVGSAESFVTIIERAATLGGSLTVVSDHGADTVLWSQLLDDAMLRRQSTGRHVAGGVAVSGPTSLEVVRALVGAWLGGCPTTVLPPPARGQDAAAHQAVMDERVRMFARTVENAEGTPLLVQFTSGSTGEPSPVVVEGPHVVANLTGVVQRASVTPDDRIVSWLPLSHDLGLVGMLMLGLVAGCDVTLLDAATYAARPSSWLELLASKRGTISAAPNFAYAVAAKHPQRADLSSVRCLFNGAEPIRPSDVRKFIEQAIPAGLDPAAMRCVYGLAEATVAVTVPPRGGMTTVSVARAELERGRVSNERGEPVVELARLGTALDGLEVRVHGDGVGEILVRGTSVPNVEADGWMHTGDTGFLDSGDLVVCGRVKDIIIVSGRNIEPTLIEGAVGEVSGVRKGNVIAFGIAAATERIVVVAEAVGAVETGDIAAAVMDAAGVRPADVVLVAPGTVPKTTSGKLQRQRCRELYLAGQFVAC